MGLQVKYDISPQATANDGREPRQRVLRRLEHGLEPSVSAQQHALRIFSPTISNFYNGPNVAANGSTYRSIRSSKAGSPRSQAT